MAEQSFYNRELSEQKRAELLHELEQSRYRLVIDEMKAAVFEWDLQTGAFYSSENYREYSMSEAAPEQVIENNAPMDVIHPDDIQALKKFFLDTKSGLTRAETILRMKLKAGGYRWCRLVGIFYKDEQGLPTRTLGIIIDISEEKEKSFMLDSLLNELPGGVAVFKAGKTLKCQYFNDGFAKLLGRERKELEEAFKNKNFIKSFIAPPDLPQLNKKITGITEDGKNANSTFRFLTSDGELRWMHMNASKLREEDGCAVYYCVFTTPSEETALYRSVVEDSTTGVLVAERKARRIVYCNERMRNIYHVEPETPIIGRLVYDVIPWRKALLNDEEVAALSPDHIAEYHRQHEECYLGIRAKAHIWNGLDCYVMYVSDETQEHQKRMQQKELLNMVPMGIGIC